jgi:hypothetical protein
VRVFYDENIDIESKRKLLTAAKLKGDKIYPIVYRNVKELKRFLD